MRRRLLVVVGLGLLLAAMLGGRAAAQGEEEPEALPTPAQLNLIDDIVIYSGVAAVIAVLVGALVSKRKFSLIDKLGPPDWSFSDSFATNITVVGRFWRRFSLQTSFQKCQRHSRQHRSRRSTCSSVYSS